eukprot:6488851-Prymnesium_polylepis.1
MAGVYAARQAGSAGGRRARTFRSLPPPAHLVCAGQGARLRAPPDGTMRVLCAGGVAGGCA